MSSFLLLQQYTACLVRFILIVFVMDGWWPYSSCFVGAASRTCSILLCILPFPKKGDLGLAKNHRGITLTSIAAKICAVNSISFQTFLYRHLK